ncbi:LAFE_0B03202g1_1 [Lachancea fermentati]|uniref:ferric-chelate reductase (NADPH) n=1 Tax=Lachancea fermentati TaxID=4955 RepID=A0A1G4M7U9_LACFM|nr:LAFE_0B03202g1_1 [Lachancea fermentati]
MRVLHWTLIIASVVRALELVDSTLASACIYYDATYDWGCGSHGNGMKAYMCRCANINWLGTVTNCMKSNSNDTGLVNHGFRHLARRCKEKGDFNYTLADMQQFYENGTKYLRAPTPRDLNNTVYTTLLVDQDTFDWYYRKFKDLTFSVERSQWFGWGLVFYWVAVVTIATIYNLNQKLFGFNIGGNFINKYLTVPTVFQRLNTKDSLLRKCFPGTWPNYLQVGVVTAFILQTIICVGVGYEMKTPHPYLTTRWFMNLDLVSYRVDLMSISLFPVIYLFGIRNNPLIPISGISFSTFNYYHKWCAYVCIILAFIHSIIWTVYSIQEGGYKTWWVDSYWQYGIGAMVLIALLGVHSIKLFRDTMYEIFLFFHKIMNIFFIVCMYYHLNILGWLGWVWSMVAIMVFDRVMRIVRIVLSGGLQSATLVDCGNGVIKMEIKKPKYLQHSPGSYSFIYFISSQDPWYFPWQSHPFTLLSAPKESGNNTLVAYFKAHKGITRHLLSKIMMSQKDSIRVKILLEGPYGNMIPQVKPVNRKFVGVAAGLGITAIHSQIMHLLPVQKSNFTNKIYWVIRDISHAEWFLNELEWIKSKNFELTIMCTSSKEFEEDTCSSYSEKKGLQSLDVQHMSGRPDLQKLIAGEVSKAMEENVDVTFISCGPTVFNGDFRTCLSRELNEKVTISVELQEESFTW